MRLGLRLDHLVYPPYLSFQFPLWTGSRSFLGVTKPPGFQYILLDGKYATTQYIFFKLAHLFGVQA